ncbi:hypothetical protein MLD38_000956, partial [Melastoma candidum]
VRLAIRRRFSFTSLDPPHPSDYVAIFSINGTRRFCACCFSWRQAGQDHSDQISSQAMNDSISMRPGNIVLNHDFSEGLRSWDSNCCEGFVVAGDAVSDGKAAASGGCYVVVTKRKECWQGLEQDITSRVSPGSTYSVSANVGVSGPLAGSADVSATLRLDFHDAETKYHFIGRKSVSKDKWENIEGKFSLASMPSRVVFYLEGPSPGIDLLIKSVEIVCLSECRNEKFHPEQITASDENIIQNPTFDDGLNNWTGRGCKIVLNESIDAGKITPQSGKYFASATERTQTWNGIQQDVTGRLQRKLLYEVTAVLRIYGNNVSNSDVRITLWIQMPDLREQYIGITGMQATDKDWVHLQGKFLIDSSPSKTVIYIEGPPAGTDILVNSLVVKRAPKTPPMPRPVIENPAFGVNIIQNSNLYDGTNGWYPLGDCNLSVQSGSPIIIPPMARDSLGPHEPLSGNFILVKNRSQTWMGPAQTITDKIKLFLTYQVSGWVKLGSGATGPQNVNVALGVDGQWVNGGQVNATSDRWHEIGGSFRIEKQPSKVMVYAQGPDPGIDLMVAGLQIFPVNREKRFKHLKNLTDKLRKRDVVVKFSGPQSSTLAGASVIINQTENSFPFGSCLNRSNIDNEDFVAFFLKNFNWSVFCNELKWYWTEPQQGNLNYRDADEMLDFCQSHNIPVRGHCIFWEVEDAVQWWVRSLSTNDLMAAVQNRLTSLLSRYKGNFRHYDVNNEMLHGSFYQDRLGKDIRANMFKIANQMDPSALLFVNDYHVEDGCDPRSSPESYIEHILNLQEQGAPVGGIGIQGHISNPVGPTVCSALDKLGILGLPIWLTEMDVTSVNEHIRGDDLEVMLREAFAHPAIDGVMFWGFWELSCGTNTHWVDAEGNVNEAGKRYLLLRKEWSTRTTGHLDQQGEYTFRGYHGTYDIQVVVNSETITKTIVVDKGESPLVISIAL